MHLIEALFDLCKGNQYPVIAIDGPAGAGKTTLASTISMALSESYLVHTIHMDDLYNGWDYALTTDLSKVLTGLVQAHKSQQMYAIQKFDWSRSAFQDPETVDPADILILEGVGSGQLSIRSNLATLIWMDIDAETGIARVITRDQQNIADIQGRMENWRDLQEKHFAEDGTRDGADFILSTDG